MLRLVTIPISHYCEKARWALERAGMPYREEPHVQGIHKVASRLAGGKGTVPVLVTPYGSIGESEEILAWVDAGLPAEQRLFPPDADDRREVRAVCRRLDEVLGPRGRRLMYVHMLSRPDFALRFNNAGVPGWEDRVIRRGFPFFRGLINRVLEIRPGIEREDEAVVWEELDFVAGLLSDGRPHLCGDRFGAADVTFAAMAAPLVVPPVYGTPLPQPEILPADTAALVERAREHPAGRYALGLYADYRRQPPEA
jgi:glutathione S-transferase